MIIVSDTTPLITLITKDEADDAFDRIRKANRHISEKLINMAIDIIHGKE